MTDVFDRAFLEGLLRADVAALASAANVAEVGFEELAYTALERAGLLRRVGEIPPDLGGALADPRTVEAALRFLRDLALDRRLEAFLAGAAEDETGARGPGEPLESPEHVDEAETLFLHRDRVQAAVGETARNLPETREARARLARILAALARFDERWRENLHEFFIVIPLIERLKGRFDWQRLDRTLYWWWTGIGEAFRRLESGGQALEDLAVEALEEDRCTEALDDVGWLRAAFAMDLRFRGRRRFAAHLPRCASCRKAVADLERLHEPAETVPVRLAAAPAAEEALEALRARTYRPPAPILGTPFSVSIGLKETSLLRLTFHETGNLDYTRQLDGSEVAIDGVGRAIVRSGAAEIALPGGRPLEAAVRSALEARRTLRLPAEPPAELRAAGRLVLEHGRDPIRLP